MSKNIDAFRYSAYLHKPRNGKIIMGPAWDWNLAYGNADYLQGGYTNGWYYAIQSQGMTANEHIWLRRLINGTGVIVHTNLGRAPLAEAALDRVHEIARGYSNLEYDVTAGGRGSRQEHVTGLQQVRRRILLQLHTHQLVRNELA